MIKDHINVDWIRGLAAVLVMISHLYLFYPGGQSLSFLSNAGHIGVEIFFVLSGFLISLSWQRDPDYSRFILKRARRILPLMWIVMACVFFILTPIFFEWSLFDPSHLLIVSIHALGLQSLIPLQIPGLFIGVPLWTLTIEICFYALLPVLWWLFIRSPAAFVVISFGFELLWSIVAEGIVAHFKLGEQWALYLPSQLPGQLFSFSLGMLLAYFFFKDGEDRSPRDCEGRLVHIARWAKDGIEGESRFIDPWAQVAAKESVSKRFCRLAGKKINVWPEDMPLWFLGKAGLICLLAGLLCFDALWQKGLTSVAFPLVACIIIWASSSYRGQYGLLVGTEYKGDVHTLFSTLGLASYSLYLWHFPILFIVYRLSDSNLPFYQFTLIGCGLSISAAFLSYRFIERPFLDFH